MHRFILLLLQLFWAMFFWCCGHHMLLWEFSVIYRVLHWTWVIFIIQVGNLGWQTNADWTW